MKYQKNTNLIQHLIIYLGLLPKKWLQVHDQSGCAKDRYKPSKQIRFKISILRSDLFDFTDAYIVVKGDITLTKNDYRGLLA